MKKLFAFLVALFFVPAISHAQLHITGGISAFGGDAVGRAFSDGNQQQQAQAAAEVSAGFNAGIKYKYKLPIPIIGINAVGHFNYATGKSQLNNLRDLRGLPPGLSDLLQGVTPPETNITALVYGIGVEVIPIGFLPIIDPYVSLDYTLNSYKEKRDAFTFQGLPILPAYEVSVSGSGLGIGVGTGIKLPIIPIVFDAELKWRMLGNARNLLTVNVGAGLSF
jgi:hypothetical protein